MQLNIVTITKNDHLGIKRTILSTSNLRNKYGAIQYIIDGSNRKIYEDNVSFYKEQKLIKYFYRESKGISDAFNFGLSKTKGKWVWFLNGGDTVYKYADLKLVKNLIKNVGSDMLIFEIVGKDGVVKHPKLLNLWPPLGWVPHPATIIKKKCLEDIGGFDNSYKIAMDGDVWMKLFSKNYVVDLVSLPLTCFADGGLSSMEYETGKEIAKLIWSNKGLLLRHWIGDALNTFRKWFIYTIKTK